MIDVTTTMSNALPLAQAQGQGMGMFVGQQAFDA